MSDENSNDAARGIFETQLANDLLADAGALDEGAGRLAYTVKQVAEMLGVSEGHLRNQHRRGALVFVHIGRSTRILAADLKKYLAGLHR